jgi:hypothetical protein
MQVYLYVVFPLDDAHSSPAMAAMDNIRAQTQNLSKEERLKLYLDTTYNLNHLRNLKATSERNKQKQAYLLELLDTLLTSFDADKIVPAAYARLLGIAHPQLGMSRVCFLQRPY